jgi:[acyl-carrier-protein] S-malonyltransferase
MARKDITISMPQASSPVFLFPGQSSADPRMLARARGAHPAAEEVARGAAAVLGAEADRYLSGPVTLLETNRDVQIGVFIATQMYLRALGEEGVSASASAGLSLGEYSHLVHIGALSFEDALRLVSQRGRCYDEAPAGVMVTVLGADRDTVQRVADTSAHSSCLVISNFNAPTQHVLSGHAEAVARAAATLEEEFGAFTTIIERRVPMHSPLMRDVARAFEQDLRRTAWRAPSADYLPNVTATPVASPAPSDIVRLLVAHVSEPVLWEASTHVLAARFPDATFVEVGPGAVLTNLLGRWPTRVDRLRIDALEEREPRTHFVRQLEVLRVCA